MKNEFSFLGKILYSEFTWGTRISVTNEALRISRPTISELIDSIPRRSYSRNWLNFIADNWRPLFSWLPLYVIMNDLRDKAVILSICKPLTVVLVSFELSYLVDFPLFSYSPSSCICNGDYFDTDVQHCAFLMLKILANPASSESIG